MSLSQTETALQQADSCPSGVFCASGKCRQPKIPPLVQGLSPSARVWHVAYLSSGDHEHTEWARGSGGGLDARAPEEPHVSQAGSAAARPAPTPRMHVGYQGHNLGSPSSPACSRHLSTSCQERRSQRVSWQVKAEIRALHLLTLVPFHPPLWIMMIHFIPWARLQSSGVLSWGIHTPRPQQQGSSYHARLPQKPPLKQPAFLREVCLHDPY